MECVKTSSFLSLPKEGIIKLISSDYVNQFLRLIPPFARENIIFVSILLQFCLEEEDVWRCVLAWAKHKAGVAAMTGRWTEEERTRICQHLAGVINHVRLLLIGAWIIFGYDNYCA